MTTAGYTPIDIDESAVQTIEDLGLFADQINLALIEIGQSAIRRTPILGQSFLDDAMFVHIVLISHLHRLTLASNRSESTNHHTSIYGLPQSNSRGPFKITADGYRKILRRIQPFSALSNVFSSFGAGTSDCYIGRSAAYFSPHSWPSSNSVLELCCILKYIERNGRTLTGAHAWSVRQMALYQMIEPTSQRETVLLANPSDAIWSHIKLQSESQPSSFRPWESWTRTPALVISRLSVNWNTYITELHNAVGEIRRNAAFTDPKEPRVGEVNGSSLKSAAIYMDLLQQASHTLQSNIHVLTALSKEGTRRAGWLSTTRGEEANSIVAATVPSIHTAPALPTTAANPAPISVAATQTLTPVSTAATEAEILRGTIEEVIRELQLANAQVKLITSRLQQTIAAIRDNISLRTSYSMERMTARSLTEARAVRVIALVTLIFLPPTFTSGFMDMGYITVVSDSTKGLALAAAPEMWLFLILTVPLLLVTVGGWVWWNRRVWRQEHFKDDLLV